MLERFDLDKTYQYLLISLAFLMPLTVSGANTIIVIICFLWLFSGDYKSDILVNECLSCNVKEYKKITERN